MTMHARDGAGTEAQLLADGRALRALARRLLRGDAAADGDADDLVQEGHAAALARPELARKPGPWLAGTVRNLAAMWRRRARRRVAREHAVARGELDVASDPAAITAAAETAARVAAAVRALDEPFRTVVVLRFWRGLLPEQIAAELAVPRNTVRSRLQRGLERLRARLDDDDGDARDDRSRGGRAPWRTALAAFVRPLDVENVAGGAAPAAAGIPRVAWLGVVMSTKVLAAAAVLVAAVLLVPDLWREPVPTSAEVAVAPAAPPPDARDTRPPSADDAPSRRAAAGAAATPVPVPVPVPVPDVAAAEPAFDASPVTVAPWLARFVVVDDDERPVAGAIVTVRHATRLPPAPGGASAPIAYGREPTGAPLCALSTDRTGQVAVTLAYEGVLAMAHQGDARTGFVVPKRAAADAPTRLLLTRPVLLRGVVRRGDGTPAVGATVTARPAVSTLIGEPAEPAPVTTDADGRFTMPVTLYGGYGLRAELAGQRSFAVQLHVDTRTPPEVVLSFPGAWSLRGIVVDANGRPVADASVRAWREPGADPAFARDGPASGATDADGAFAFDVRSPGRYELLAAADGHAQSDVVAADPSPEQPQAVVRLALQRHATIAGVVCRGDGSPFPEVAVYPQLENAEAGGTARVTPRDRFGFGRGATTGADGRFELQVHPGTTWTVTAYPIADNFQFVFRELDVMPGRDDVRFIVRDDELAGCVVRGGVRTAVDGQAVTAFEVSLVSFDAAGRVRAVSPLRGAKVLEHRFELPLLPLGRTFAIEVRPLVGTGPRPGAGQASSETLAPVRLGPFVTTAAGVELDMRVPAWGELPVQVLAADGAPAHGLFVRATREPELGNVRRGARRLEAEGRVVLVRCAPGPHTVEVLNEREIVHSAPLDVQPGRNAELVLRLPAAAATGGGR